MSSAPSDVPDEVATAGNWRIDRNETENQASVEKADEKEQPAPGEGTG